MSDYPYQRILLYNASRIGDVVSSLVVANYLRDQVGNVDLLVNENYFSMFETEPGIHPVSRDQALEREYDLVVDLTSGKDSRRFVRRVRAREKLGFYRNWHHRLRLMFTYTAMRRKVVVRGGTEQDHIMTGFYPMLEFLGTGEPLRPTLHPGRATETVDRLLEEARAGQPKVVAIHFGASNPKRRPPDPLLHDIIGHITGSGCGVILLGDEKELAERLMAASDGRARLFQGDLNDLKYLLSEVDLFIGPCSGPLHMAAALGKESIGLYGPTITRISAPVSEKLTVIEIDLPCRPCTPKHHCTTDLACLRDLPRATIFATIDRHLGTP